MSSFGKTKREIINLLSKRQQTLTDLSKTLDLSPSTVKQHLEELEAVGAILPVENEFIRRWKYYKPNPEFGVNHSQQIGRFVPYVVGAAVILAIAYVFAFSGIGGMLHNPVINSNTINSTSGTALMSVRLTDPPNVPPGTQALYVKYSSVELHVVSNNTWVKTNGNGTLNLMSLINSSQVISNVYISDNAVMDSVKLNVTNATININGTNYSVAVVSPNIKAVLEQPQSVGQNQSVLLDFSPTVAAVYGINGTSFILVPALKAVFLANGTKNPGKIGAVTSLQSGERAVLSMQSNISVLNATLAPAPSGAEPSNQTITLNLKNNGNSTVDLTQVIIQGRLQFYLNTKMAQPASPPVWPIMVSQGRFVGGNLGAGINASSNATLNISIPWRPAPLPTQPLSSWGIHNASSNGTVAGRVDGMLLFVVESNGTMELPTTDNGFLNAGYQLQPGKSVRLRFNGTLSFAKGRIEIGLLTNETYHAAVISSQSPVANFDLKAQ